MIAANDTDISFLHAMTADQLRLVLGHASGLLAHRVDIAHASNVLCNIRRQLNRAPEEAEVPIVIARERNAPSGMITREVLNAALEEASAFYGVKREEILGPRKRRPISYARQYAMWLLRQETYEDGSARYSFPEIACALNLKCHTSVLHGVRAHEARLQAQQEAA